MKKALFYVLTLWMVLWFQVLSNHLLGGTAFSVQWIFLVVLYLGLTRGPWVGESFGFVAGLLLDASSLGLLGLNALLFAIGGYTAGMLKRQLDASKLWTQTIFSWMSSLVFFIAYFLVTRLLTSGEKNLEWAFLSVPILNAFMAPVVFRVIAYWSWMWDVSPAEREF